jgi:outer membrane protein, multidrug efflux system
MTAYEQRTQRPRSSSLGIVIGLAAALVVTTGCATARLAPKAPAPSVQVPGAWMTAYKSSVPAPAADLSTWWTQLGDPVLTGLIEQAVDANTDIRSARSKLRQARATRDLAKANRLPTVSGSASLSGSHSTKTDSFSGTFSPGIDASWEPDVFGASLQGVRAADADLLATEADLYNTRVSLVAEVGLGYVDVRSEQMRLQIAKSNETSQAETLQITEWRAQAGLASDIDVAEAKTNYLQTKAQIPSLESSLAQYENALAILLSLPPGALHEKLSAAKPLPVPPASVAMGIPAEALRQRPDLHAAELRLLAEAARTAQTSAGKYPTFSLSGSLGLNTLFGASTGTSLVSSLVGSAARFIFDGGRLRQQVAIQTEVQEQALVNYESTILTALQDVENALMTLNKLREREVILVEATASARNASTLAKERYKAGLVDFQTVLTADRTVLTLEDTLATVQASKVSAVISLYKALGGGWSPVGATPVKAQTGTQS